MQPLTLPEIPQLAPLLKEYKALLKSTSRDASLRSRRKMDVTKLLRDVERWIGEVTVIAGTVLAGGLSFAGAGDYQDDSKERWALERLCEAMCGKGGLVPVSRKCAQPVFPI